MPLHLNGEEKTGASSSALNLEPQLYQRTIKMPGRSGALETHPRNLGKAFSPPCPYLPIRLTPGQRFTLGTIAHGALARRTCTEGLWLAGTVSREQLWRQFTALECGTNLKGARQARLARDVSIPDLAQPRVGLWVRMYLSGWTACLVCLKPGVQYPLPQTLGVVCL